ncbi:MAG: peroxiredoxin [Calditrichaeota bacterium]|nr:DsrE family protein [Calditrichota bacterium]RQV93042.1 MAG: peroxiredoxin [bacterium]RQW03933.1 MAG: peroxiredoxin [Calditrichota bacterium]
MKKLLFTSLILIFIFFSCQNGNISEELPLPASDGIMVHITHGSDDPHRVLMGLQMAVLMSEDKDVLVYFDIKGIEVVLKDAKDFTYSHFPGSKTQIQKLLSSDVPVMACPGCLKAAGKTPEDLLEGVQVADKNQFFNFTEGRILTIDY